jgi:hypothetical protein
MVRVGVRRGVAAGLAAALALSAAPAFAQAASDLFGTCFVRQSPNAAPTYRVASIAVLFQGFGEDLLASVAYRLRFGTAFGISGDCSEPAAGGYLCHACANSDCAGGEESFRVLWRGGETVTLVNDRTGMLGTNSAGGRDYLWAGGRTRAFVLDRAAVDDCAW